MTDKAPATLTNQQRRGLHLGFQHIADTLNLAGLDMRTVLKPEVDIPWTKQSVKEFLYLPIVRAMYGKEHTSDLEKIEEPGAAWETMMRFLMEKHHIEYIDFPSHALGHADTAPMHKDKEHYQK